MAAIRRFQGSRTAMDVDESPLYLGLGSDRISMSFSRKSMENKQFLMMAGKREVQIATKVALPDMISLEEMKNRGTELAFMVDYIANSVIDCLKAILKMRTSWKLQANEIIQTVVINCRFFTFIPIAGSLLGSILCFTQGCFFVIKAYLRYLHAISSHSKLTVIMELLIESIEMFLIGGAMVTFGLGLYVLFISPRKETGVPAGVKIERISEAKSRIGHTLAMILHVGLLEKLKNIALISALDLAYLAAAILISSASIFLLSRLSIR